MGANDRFSRTIPKSKLRDAAQWDLRPLAAGPQVGSAARLSARPSDSERARDGYEAGRQQGYADAMRSVQQARSADLQRLESVLAGLRAEFDGLASGAADALLDLAVDIAAQVLRREIAQQRDAALPAVREALALVAAAHAHPTVRLAPADFEFVREALSGEGQFQGCRFLSDATIAPGGCRVETAQGEVDATLATRWRRVLQTLGVDAAAAPLGPSPAASAAEAGPPDPGP